MPFEEIKNTEDTLQQEITELEKERDDLEVDLKQQRQDGKNTAQLEEKIRELTARLFVLYDKRATQEEPNRAA